MKEVSDIRIVAFKTQSECEDGLYEKGLVVLEGVEMVALMTDEQGRRFQARGAASNMVFRRVQVECTMCKDGIDVRKSEMTGLTYVCEYCQGTKIRSV